MIFQPISPRGEHLPEPFLAYAYLYDPVPQVVPGATRADIRPNSNTGMYVLTKACRADGSRLGDVILLESILEDIEVVPKFSEDDGSWSRFNAREKGKDFYLNHYCDPEVFFRFEL